MKVTMNEKEQQKLRNYIEKNENTQIKVVGRVR